MHVRNDAEELSGIECVAGGARVVVASPAIAQIVEYAVSPLPLGRPFIAGLAVHAGDLVVSVRATAEVLTAPRRATKAVLLVAKSGASLRCALEIDEVLSFVRARPLKKDARAESVVAPWIGRALCDGDREVAWLDVERLFSAIEDAGAWS